MKNLVLILSCVFLSVTGFQFVELEIPLFLPPDSDAHYKKSCANDLSFEAVLKAYENEIYGIGSIIGNTQVDCGPIQLLGNFNEDQLITVSQFANVSALYIYFMNNLKNEAISQMNYMNNNALSMEQLRYSIIQTPLITNTQNSYALNSGEVCQINKIIDEALPHSSYKARQYLEIFKKYIQNAYNIKYTSREIFEDATGYDDPNQYDSEYSNPLDFGYRKQGFSASQALEKLRVLDGIYITWTDLVGVQADSNGTLTKTNQTNWWNSGAASVNVLPPNENGWIETEVKETNTNRMFGLSYSNPNETWNSIRYNIYLRSGGGINIYENGSNKGSYGTYKVGDKMRIERKSNTINYIKNGNTIYSSPTDPTKSLIADVSLYTPGGTIWKAKSSFDKQTLFDIAWTDLVRTTADWNTLTRDGSSNGWKAAAASINELSANEDGWIEMTADGNNTYRMFGLSSTNWENGNDWSQHWSSIEYNFYVRSDGKIQIYESGVNKCSCGSYSDGDKIKVERKGSKILYKLNDQTIYTSTTNPNQPLIADVALYTSYSNIYDAKASFVTGSLVASLANGQTQFLASTNAKEPYLTKTSPSEFNEMYFNEAQIEDSSRISLGSLKTLETDKELVIKKEFEPEPFLSDSLYWTKADKYKNFNLILYPNPTQDFVKLQYLGKEKEHFVIAIINSNPISSNGKSKTLEWQASPEKSNFEIDMRNLKKGNYIIRVKSDNNVESIHVIRQ